MKKKKLFPDADDRSQFLATFIREMDNLDWTYCDIAKRLAWVIDALYLGGFED